MCVFGLLYGFHAVRTQRGFIDPPQELGKWSFMTVKLSLSLLEKGCGKLATLVNFEVHITLSCQYNMATEELVSSIHDIIDHLMPCFYWFFIHYVNQMILT